MEFSDCDASRTLAVSTVMFTVSFEREREREREREEEEEEKIKNVLNSTKGVRQSGLLMHSVGIDKLSTCKLLRLPDFRLQKSRGSGEERRRRKRVLTCGFGRSKHSKIIVGEETVSSRVTVLFIQ